MRPGAFRRRGAATGVLLEILVSCTAAREILPNRDQDTRVTVMKKMNRVKAFLIAIPLASPVMAHEPPSSVSAGNEQPENSQVRSSTRIFRDPVTGKFREPTEEELRQMPQSEQGSNNLQGEQSPQVIKRDHGVLMVPPSADTMYFAVARRNEDGEIETNCEPAKAGDAGEGK